ncbi:MAG TPA: HU family DNA-binding protein, partial [Rhizomicrobium sp.]|nr:HU family DNA-binding protein [Rhizomicrobium sp.]
PIVFAGAFGAKKCLIFRAFLHRCGKSPYLLRFFEVLPLYLAGNAVKSGSSLIRLKRENPMATAAKAKVETVSTRQLAGQLAEKHELSQKSANAILEDTIGLITKHLKKGARIRLNGLGILVVRKRGPRMGRNPATGEAIKIKASKKVAFRASKELKEAI